MGDRGRKIDILVLGGGGREHALVHALSRSGIAGKLHCAPGNPGIAELATLHAVDPGDTGTILKLCATEGIGLVVVGPEVPLVAGVADALRADGIPVFGPGASGARLEGSKAFAKTFMARHGIPTAPFRICTTMAACRAALAERRPPYVIKADGLAAGKGVFLPDTEAEALDVCSMLIEHGRLGDAGRTVVVEDFTPGLELTVFAITDGTDYRILSPSRDHKRVYEGDKGPNTGGMGAYSPVRLPADALERAVDRVLKPTLAGLKADGIDYRGVLYMGLMLTESAEGTQISVVEYNVRFGDPETQAVLPLITGDFGEIVHACARGRLATCPDLGNAGHAVCVIAASAGYPDGAVRKGLPIAGLENEMPDAYVFHAGTKRLEDGTIVTDGGRVLAVVGFGESFGKAKERAYARLETVSFEGMHYRRDIGWSEER